MLTSPSFETGSSFQGADSVESFDDLAESLETHNDEWGIVTVSNNGSELLLDQVSDGSDYAGGGVMILDGEVDTSSNNEFSDLSIPGTDSLPTDLGSLSDDNDTGYCLPLNSWVFRKRPLLLFGFFIFALCTFGGGLLLRERNSWRSSTLRLEQEIQRLEYENALKLEQEIQRLEREKEEEIRRLEREKEEVKSSCESESEPEPEWLEDDQSEESSFFTILDNCWIRATANIKLGPCGGEKKESLRDFAKETLGNWGALFNMTTSLHASMMMEKLGAMGEALQRATTFQSENSSSCEGDCESAEDEKKDHKPSPSMMPSFPLYLGEAIAKTFSLKMTKPAESSPETGNISTPDFEDSKIGLLEASAVLTEAMIVAQEAMTSEFKELSGDPLNYLAAAVKGASQAGKPEQVTMKGLFEALAASNRGEALAQTGEVVSVQATEMMDDPLSYFEYETEVKQD
jgi:hypothetical protein